MWPQWQGQHHGPAGAEQHVPPQSSQPEVFPVRRGPSPAFRVGRVAERAVAAGTGRDGERGWLCHDLRRIGVKLQLMELTF